MKGETMNSDEKLLKDLERVKRENPQWFDVICKAAELPDDELHEFIEKVTAYIANKKTTKH